MTVEEFAAKLNGRQYGNEITEDEAILARNLDFLVVFGESDDLAELRGAIDGECDCFEGGVLKRGEGHTLPIKAVWCPDGRDCSWAYETDLPHAEFKIMEEGEVYCYGIVCALNGTPKMYRCPLCGEDKLHIGVHDDEGNYHGELGCAYESDPWSGLSYGIHHDGWGECLLCTDDTNGVAGGMLFDTPQKAHEAISKLTGGSEKEPSMAPPEIFFQRIRYNDHEVQASMRTLWIHALIIVTSRKHVKGVHARVAFSAVFLPTVRKTNSHRRDPPHKSRRN